MHVSKFKKRVADEKHDITKKPRKCVTLENPLHYGSLALAYIYIYTHTCISYYTGKSAFPDIYARLHARG